MRMGCYVKTRTHHLRVDPEGVGLRDLQASLASVMRYQLRVQLWPAVVHDKEQERIAL